MRKAVFTALWGFVLLLPSLASAEAFYCGTRIISTGDRMGDVQARCGSPDFITQRTVHRWVEQAVERSIEGRWVRVLEGTSVDVPVEEWTYDFGPQSFIRYVTFENGHITEISTGAYGRQR